EERGVDDLSWSREPPHWDVHEATLGCSRIVAPDREQERSLHRPRAERVHSDVLLRELDTELSRHRQDGALRGRIRDLRGCCAEERHERGDVDDGATATLDQMRDAVLAAEVDAA